MADLNEVELFLQNEFSARDESTFLYQLDRNGYFDVAKASALFEAISVTIDQYQLVGKSDFYVDFLKGSFFAFEHLLFLVACHYMEDDVFKINNYLEVLSSEIISDYYYNIRALSARLIF